MTKDFYEQLIVLREAEAHNKFTVRRPILENGMAKIDVPFVKYRTKAIVESIEGPSKLDYVMLGLASTGEYSDFSGIAKALGAGKFTKMLRMHFNELRLAGFLRTGPLKLTCAGNEFLNSKRQDSHKLTCDLEFYRNELAGKIVDMKATSFSSNKMNGEIPFRYNLYNPGSEKNILWDILSAQRKGSDGETDKKVLDDDVIKFFNTKVAPNVSDSRGSDSKIQWFKRIEEGSYNRRITVSYAAIRFTKRQSTEKEIDEEIKIYAPNKHDRFYFKYDEDTTNALNPLIKNGGFTPEWRS